MLHRGVIQLEKLLAGIGPDSLFTGRAMTRSLLSPLVAIAMQEGAIESLDDPVGRYLPEWSDDGRGRITLRQLLRNLSGLENPPLAGDPDPYSKNARISLSSDFRAAALSFDLENEPGEFFAFSNANAQLVGAVLESATGEPYEDYLNSRLWAPLGAGPAQLYMDRPGGMPAVYCCYRATPRDWLRYGAALAAGGLVADRRLWPEGWVQEMTAGSGVYPNYGYQIWVGNPPGTGRPYVQDREQAAPHGPPIEADGVFFLEGGGFRTMYVIPGEELVILRLGYFPSRLAHFHAAQPDPGRTRRLRRRDAEQQAFDSSARANRAERVRNPAAPVRVPAGRRGADRPGIASSASLPRPANRTSRGTRICCARW